MVIFIIINKDRIFWALKPWIWLGNRLMNDSCSLLNGEKLIHQHRQLMQLQPTHFTGKIKEFLKHIKASLYCLATKYALTPISFTDLFKLIILNLSSTCTLPAFPIWLFILAWSDLDTAQSQIVFVPFCFDKEQIC